jgi:hypothetical protein
LYRRRAASALAALLALLLLGPGEALASKEKFVRTKPHVNVGTIGKIEGRTVAATLALVELPDAWPLGALRPCSGVFDVRVVPAEGGTPFAETRDVRVTPDEPLGFAFRAADVGARGAVHLEIVARDMRLVDGRRCILRGSVEVTEEASGETAFRYSLGREDFLALGPARGGEDAPAR